MLIAVIRMDIVGKSRPEGLAQFEAGDFRPCRIQIGPSSLGVDLEDHLFDTLHDRLISHLARVQSFSRSLARNAKGNAIGHRGHLLQRRFAEGTTSKERHGADQSFFQRQRIPSVGDDAFARGPRLIRNPPVTNHPGNQSRFTQSRLGEIERNLHLLEPQSTRIRQYPGARVQLERSVV